MANMQSLLDVEDSINVSLKLFEFFRIFLNQIDDIENDVHTSESENQLSDTDENPDELWESPDSRHRFNFFVQLWPDNCPTKIMIMVYYSENVTSLALFQ